MTGRVSAVSEALADFYCRQHHGQRSGHCAHCLSVVTQYALPAVLAALDTPPALGEDERAALAELLSEHRDDMETGDYAEVLWSGCICGDEHPYDQHDLHIADVILAARAHQPTPPEQAEAVDRG